MHQQKDWTSILYLNEPFCNLYQPIFDLYDDSRVYVQYEFHGVYLEKKSDVIN